MLEHGDNLGNAGALTAGDIQWMTAARGIIHRELAFRNERAHTVQLWVNLPGELKMAGTRYQDLRAVDRPVIERDGIRIDLISGNVGGAAGPAQNYWPVTGTLITLEPGRSLEHLLPGRDRAFFYVLSGAVTVAGRPVRAGQIAWSDPVPGAAVTTIALAAADGDRESVVMAYSGQPIGWPIGQPVVMGGPFVMNTKTEITQAFSDFHSGKFGDIPPPGPPEVPLNPARDGDGYAARAELNTSRYSREWCWSAGHLKFVVDVDGPQGHPGGADHRVVFGPGSHVAGERDDAVLGV